MKISFLLTIKFLNLNNYKKGARIFFFKIKKTARSLGKSGIIFILGRIKSSSSVSKMAWKDSKRGDSDCQTKQNEMNQNEHFDMICKNRWKMSSSVRNYLV